MTDVLTGRPVRRGTRPGQWGTALAGLVLLLAAWLLLAGRGSAPNRAELELRELDGSVLSGDSYVRFHLELRARGADRVSQVEVVLQGQTATGVLLSPPDELGRVVVQVDVSPACPLQELVDGAVRARLVGPEGTVTRQVQLPVQGRVERLLSYQCRD